METRPSVLLIQNKDESQKAGVVETNQAINLTARDGLLVKAIYAHYGRRRVRRSPFLYSQTMAELTATDLENWADAICFIKVSGFTAPFPPAGDSVVASWYTLAERPRFCPAIHSKRMVNGKVRHEFSTLLAKVKTTPNLRPLCISGDPVEWLRLSAQEAASRLYTWQVGEPDLISNVGNCAEQ